MEKEAFLVRFAVSSGGVGMGTSAWILQVWVHDIARSIGFAYWRIFSREFCAWLRLFDSSIWQVKVHRTRYLSSAKKQY